MINTNVYILSRTVSKLLQIIGQICAFEAPCGGLGATYDVHLRLIGKLVGDFLLVIIELFFARCFRFVTVHALDRQTDVDSKVRSNELDAHKNDESEPDICPDEYSLYSAGQSANQSINQLSAD